MLSNDSSYRLPGVGIYHWLMRHVTYLIINIGPNCLIYYTFYLCSFTILNKNTVMRCDHECFSLSQVITETKYFLAASLHNALSILRPCLGQFLFTQRFATRYFIVPGVASPPRKPRNMPQVPVHLLKQNIGPWQLLSPKAPVYSPFLWKRRSINLV